MCGVCVGQTMCLSHRQYLYIYIYIYVYIYIYTHVCILPIGMGVKYRHAVYILCVACALDVCMVCAQYINEMVMYICIYIYIYSMTHSTPDTVTLGHYIRYFI